MPILKLAISDAQKLARMLDFYTRIGIGQYDELGYLYSTGVLKAKNDCGDTPFEINNLSISLCVIAGFTRGSSLGIGHANCHITVRRAYEIKKCIDQALAYHRDSHPKFKGVDYDGVLVRYTQDVIPTAHIIITGNLAMLEINVTDEQNDVIVTVGKLFDDLYNGNLMPLADLFRDGITGVMSRDCEDNEILFNSKVQMFTTVIERIQSILSK